MMAKDKCIIIFSGFNQRAIISFLRTLEKNKLNYSIVAKSKDDDIFLTQYKNNVLAVRDSIPLLMEDILKQIDNIKKIYKGYQCIIAPTTEALNRFLLANRLHFENSGCIVPLVEKPLYELISDKYSFGTLCLKNNISVPREYKLHKDISLPLVAKPKHYFSISTGEVLSPVIIKTRDELDRFIKSFNVGDFYFQEFIGGRTYYLLYYFAKTGMVYKYSQENLMQQPGGKSVIAAISSDFHHTEESAKYVKLFKALGYFGFVMVEVKHYHGKYYMVEANPRFWGPSQLFVDAGINLFEAFLQDIGMLSSVSYVQELPYKVRYFWAGGAVGCYQNSMKPDFYNYSEGDFLMELPDWLSADVYRRADTIDIFRKELALL